MMFFKQHVYDHVKNSGENNGIWASCLAQRDISSAFLSKSYGETNSIQQWNEISIATRLVPPETFNSNIT